MYIYVFAFMHNFLPACLSRLHGLSMKNSSNNQSSLKYLVSTCLKKKIKTYEITFPHHFISLVFALHAAAFYFYPQHLSVLSRKASLHRRLLSRNSMQFLLRAELHQVLSMFETSAILRRQNRRWFTRSILELQLRARQKLHQVARQNRSVKGPYA